MKTPLNLLGPLKGVIIPEKVPYWQSRRRKKAPTKKKKLKIS